MKLFIAILTLSACLLSCNDFLCGELTGEWKKQLEQANATGFNLKVVNTPCEFFYINVTATTGAIDTSAIHAVHKILYNKETNVGWRVLLVHDSTGKYLFSHGYNDNIYIQTGD